MAMSSKHYKQFADMLGKAYADVRKESRTVCEDITKDRIRIIDSIADGCVEIFNKDNRNFNSDIFYEAVLNFMQWH